jgi:PAS domain S-box-containing protein
MNATTRTMQTVVDRELESIVRTLQTLTTSAYLLEGNLEGFRKRAERVLSMQKGWENITLIDPSGNNLMSLRAPLDYPVLDREHFELAMQSGEPVVHNLKKGQLVGVSVPVQGSKLEYVLTACLRPDMFADLLRKENLPSKWIGIIHDGKGRIVTRTDDSAAIGELADPGLWQAVASADRGWTTVRTLDNVRSYVAFSRSAGSQWSTVIAVPVAVLEIPVYKRLLVVAGSGLFVLGIGIWMAFIRADRIARPVEKLSANSTALGKGFFPVAPLSFVKEIRNLQEKFRQADSDLFGLTTQLEQRIHERTAELRQQIEEKDKAKEDLLEQAELLELSHDGIVVRSFSDSRIKFWSSGATELYGWTKDEALGQGSHTLLQTHFPQSVEEIEDQLRRYGRWDGELVHTKKDGTRIIVSSRWSLRRDPSRNPVDVLELAYDITAKKDAQQRLLEKERLASLGLTAAVFAHEVANPLHNLNSAMDLLDRELTAGGHTQSGIKLVRAATGEIQRLNTLLDEFRFLARPQTLSRQRVNFRQIVEEVLAPMRPAQEEANIAVELQFDDALPQIKVDRDKIKQVIVNLCKNAVEAMPDGGRLTLKSYCSDRLAVFEVSDTGIGIPEGMDVFHLFTTTKAHGTGLGLPIVEQIIAAHGGHIAFMSHPGKGTTFKISLPFDADEHESMDALLER